MGKYSKQEVKKPFYKSAGFWALIFCLAAIFIADRFCSGSFAWMYIVVLVIAWLVYESKYYNSSNFLELKKRIESYTNDCNELNRHIEELKQVHLGDNRLDAGTAVYTDNSKYKYQRKELKKQQHAPNVHNCSRTVCDGARKEPFKYICKYFNIQPNENNLEQFETMLNNFEAANDGLTTLKTEKEKIKNSISSEIPYLIREFSRKLDSKLGFEPIDLSEPPYPRYTFQYISSGGNASTKCDIVMDMDNLNRFVEYLSSRIRFNKSVAGQRALMTSKLRQKIKERDNYTCRKCGLSIEQEPNLLLEIDHIVPVSKGGLTTEDNLQTLCWRCNRSKGAKVSP